ncbi:10729_t:CDS:2, partial [Acaulospora morrowiae]
PSAAQKIFIVANSYGGHCAVDAVQTYFEELKDRLMAIEFAASTHSIDFVKSNRLKIWIRENCRNWLMSDLPIGEEILDARFGCICLSANCEYNEYVTTSVIDYVFDFFVKNLTMPDIYHEAMDDDEYDENILENLDKAQKIFAGDSLVNDVQDKIQFGDYTDCPIYPLSEKGSGSGSGWD